MVERKGIEDRDWAPFRTVARGERALPSRPIGTRDGVGDRLRTAAFAELQAREAFLWAADRFKEAPKELRAHWRELAGDEGRHLGWLLGRMKALRIDPAERCVSTRLWDALAACRAAREFAELIARAEERGRLAGEGFRNKLSLRDPESAEIFGRIADEEIDHVSAAARFFPRETVR